MTAAKRFVKETRGASSNAEAVPGSPTGDLSRFQGVTIGQPQAESGGLVAAEFKSTLVASLRKELTQGKEPLFRGGTPILTIEPHVMWFNKGNAMFPHRYAVTLFYLLSDGADVGRVQIVTKSEASRTGADDLAEDMAKELAKYIKKHGKGKKGSGEDKDD